MGFLSLKKPENEVGAAWPSIMVGAFAAFAGILYGYDTGNDFCTSSPIQGLTDN
jgi:SP family sugar:H+ symporter-like MFS transporter